MKITSLCFWVYYFRAHHPNKCVILRPEKREVGYRTFVGAMLETDALMLLFLRSFVLGRFFAHFFNVLDSSLLVLLVNDKPSGLFLRVITWLIPHRSVSVLIFYDSVIPVRSTQI